MPTRIVIRDANLSSNRARIPPHREGEFRRQTAGFTQRKQQDEVQHAAYDNRIGMTKSKSGLTRAGSKRSTSSGGSSGQNLHTPSRDRKVVGFRSSILREFSRRGLEGIEEGDETTELNDNDDDATSVSSRRFHLSNDDIRASPRLLGYLFGMIAASVMLVSVLRFYQRNEASLLFYQKNKATVKSCNNQNAKLSAINNTDFVLELKDNHAFFCSDNGPVYYWKFYGSFLVSLLGVIVFFTILLLHFDTICFPKTWFRCFRDGSHYERNVLFGLLLFWAIALHISTSSLSVGEVQANVFFTTWIAFGSTALNYGVWREGANLPSLAEKVNHHIRETTYNWWWTLLFQIITAGAGTDLYFSRNDITLRYRGKILELNDEEWIRVIYMVWGLVGVCILSLLLNYVWVRPWKLYFGSAVRIVISWRYLEGLVIFSMVGVQFFIILEYTGVDGVISGLNNAYFGLWGAFFNSCFALGTWLRENKDIDLF